MNRAAITKKLLALGVMINDTEAYNDIERIIFSEISNTLISLRDEILDAEQSIQKLTETKNELCDIVANQELRINELVLELCTEKTKKEIDDDFNAEAAREY